VPETIEPRGSDLPLLWGRSGFWQIKLRWGVAPLMIAAIVAGRALGFEFREAPIVAIALASLAYNSLFAWLYSHFAERLEADRRLDRLLTSAEVLADYLAMFLLIFFTGGVTSPVVVFLIFHVIIGAVQFPARTAYQFAGFAAAGLWLLWLGDVSGWIESSEILFRGVPVHDSDHAVYDAVLLGFFTGTLFFTAAMVSRIMRTLRQRVEDVAAANRERTAFMLQVAHNLRAPLGASLSMIELLHEGYLGEVNDKQVDYLRRVRRRLKSLHGMIGDILTIGRTRDWSREIPDVAVNMVELAERTRRTFEQEAADKRIAFEVEVDRSLPLVDSGEDLLEKVMENLVSNAIKYTPEGGEVTVRIAHGGEDEVLILVRDSGIGIPADEQDKLFREFFRASNAKRHTADGSGLGLALVKKTVERHSGRLNLDSREGEGTTVEIRLPIRQEKAA
jgi:signal transduction histidine kinase